MPSIHPPRDDDDDDLFDSKPTGKPRKTPIRMAKPTIQPAGSYPPVARHLYRHRDGFPQLLVIDALDRDSVDEAVEFLTDNLRGHGDAVRILIGVVDAKGFPPSGLDISEINANVTRFAALLQRIPLPDGEMFVIDSIAFTFTEEGDEDLDDEEKEDDDEEEDADKADGVVIGVVRLDITIGDLNDEQEEKRGESIHR